MSSVIRNPFADMLLKQPAATNLITIIRDPHRHLSKAYTRRDDGTILKEPGRPITRGEAVTHRVATLADEANVFRNAAGDSHIVLMLGGFAGIEPGESFEVWSESEIEKAIKAKGRDQTKGVHLLYRSGQQVKVVGRFKENMVASQTVLIDRDVDGFTPERFAKMPREEWLAEVDRLLPGIALADRLHVASNSARVLDDRKPYSAGNGHLFVRFKAGFDLDVLRNTLRVRMIELDLAWKKPKLSKGTDKVVGYMDCGIIDLGTLNIGRLVYDGAPHLVGDLELGPPCIEVVRGRTHEFDASLIELATPQRVEMAGQKIGLSLQARADGSGRVVAIEDFSLTLDTLIDAKEHGEITVAAAMGIGSKLRCQAPFRESTSWAAFLDFDHSGRPFVHDMGTGTTHRLTEVDWRPIRGSRIAQEFDGVVHTSKELMECAAATRRNEQPQAFRPAATIGCAVDPLRRSTVSLVAPGDLLQSMDEGHFLVDGFLEAGALAMLWGPPESFKSFIALDWSLHIAHGLPWFGMPVREGIVISVAGEGRRGMAKRVQGWMEKHEIATLKNFYVTRGGVNAREGKFAADLLSICSSIGHPALIVFDTLHRNFGGGDENQAKDVGELLDVVDRQLAQTMGATVLIVHHATKEGGNYRGSSALKGGIDVEYEVVRKGNACELHNRKMKDAERAPTLSIVLEAVGGDDDGTD